MVGCHAVLCLAIVNSVPRTEGNEVGMDTDFVNHPWKNLINCQDTYK